MSIQAIPRFSGTYQVIPSGFAFLDRRAESAFQRLNPQISHLPEGVEVGLKPSLFGFHQFHIRTDNNPFGGGKVHHYYINFLPLSSLYNFIQGNLEHVTRYLATRNQPSHSTLSWSA